MEPAPKEKEGKDRWHIFPFRECREVLKAFEFGVQKYGKPFTYRQGDGLPQEDMFDATMRHLEQIQAGEHSAADSNCLHWAHIAADALMAITRELKEREAERNAMSAASLEIDRK